MRYCYRHDHMLRAPLYLDRLQIYWNNSCIIIGLMYVRKDATFKTMRSLQGPLCLLFTFTYDIRYYVVERGII